MIPRQRMGSIIVIFLLMFAGVLSGVRGSAGENYEIVPQNYLRWNYTRVNKNCSDAGGGQNPCMDVRICNFVVASLAMGGWPATCGWVGMSVPKVCCGLPLVLGKKLMEKVDEEKARKRRCGTRTFESNLSETESKFFQIVRSLPEIDTSDPTWFDPPLAETGTLVSPVGGVPSRQGEFPWMVSIRKAGNHWCSGTLIDRNHILSAAHCFVEDKTQPNVKDYTVHVGNIHVDEGYPFGVIKIVVHPQYTPPSYYHDIAVLTLSDEILSPMFAHICLPYPELAAMDLTGKNTTLLGWGHTSFGGKETSTLHIVDNLPVVPFQQCKTAYRRVASANLPEGLTEDFICAGLEEGGKDACQMDSGGSLMYRNNYQNLPDGHPNIPWVQVGVESFGFGCGESGFPGVYIKVGNYMDWINKTINTG